MTSQAFSQLFDKHPPDYDRPGEDRFINQP
jgi:hypothetical protein